MQVHMELFFSPGNCPGDPGARPVKQMYRIALSDGNMPYYLPASGLQLYIFMFSCKCYGRKHHLSVSEAGHLKAADGVQRSELPPADTARRRKLSPNSPKAAATKTNLESKT